MIEGEGKGIFLFNTRFLRTVNNAFPGDAPPFFFYKIDFALL